MGSRGTGYIIDNLLQHMMGNDEQILLFHQGGRSKETDYDTHAGHVV